MSLTDALTDAAQNPGGLTVLDLNPRVFDAEAPIPEPDLTGSIWPMRDSRGWWIVHGFAGKHRRQGGEFWLTECLTCGYEQTSRTGRLLNQRGYCNHKKATE